MTGLSKITPYIHRLVIPFENIYTTVFIIHTPTGAILFDTATYESDADNYILPSLQELGIAQDSLKCIVLSHSHRDHAGGLDRLAEFFPAACIVSRSDALLKSFSDRQTLFPDAGSLLLGSVEMIPVPGHAPDCLALYDRRTRTLLTGDSLQLYGIYGSGKWGANISFPDEHLAAVERLRAMDIELLVASHDYHPCGYIARGPEEINRYLDCCGEALRKIQSFIFESPDSDDHTLADRYNQTFGLPAVGTHVFTAIRNANFK